MSGRVRGRKAIGLLWRAAAEADALQMLFVTHGVCRLSSPVFPRQLKLPVFLGMPAKKAADAVASVTSSSTVQGQCPNSFEIWAAACITLAVISGNVSS